MNNWNPNADNFDLSFLSFFLVMLLCPLCQTLSNLSFSIILKRKVDWWSRWVGKIRARTHICFHLSSAWTIFILSQSVGLSLLRWLKPFGGWGRSWHLHRCWKFQLETSAAVLTKTPLTLQQWLAFKVQSSPWVANWAPGPNLPGLDMRLFLHGKLGPRKFEAPHFPGPNLLSRFSWGWQEGPNLPRTVPK